jgi:hypothetical protein
MIFVNRDFECPYDDRRIWMYPYKNERVLCVNVINIHTQHRPRNDNDDTESTMGEAWMEIEYPEGMHMFDAMVAVLNQITRDFELEFTFQDCIYDPKSRKEVAFTRLNVENAFNGENLVERVDLEDGLYRSNGVVNANLTITYEPLKTNGSLMQGVTCRH